MLSTVSFVLTNNFIEYALPIRVFSGNIMEHPQARGRRVFRQRRFIRDHVRILPSAHTYQITMTRVGCKFLDGDNLGWGLKAFRDELSTLLGVRSDLDARWGGSIHWRNEQEISVEEDSFRFALKIRIEPDSPPLLLRPAAHLKG